MSVIIIIAVMITLIKIAGASIAIIIAMFCFLCV